MRIPPIETEEEYDQALARLMELMETTDSATVTAEREALLQAIETYEDEAFPNEPLPPKI